MNRRNNNEELYGGIPDWILGRFGITQEHIDKVKDFLDCVETKEYTDRTEININLKNIKVIIKK